jgi:SAM-dependent methyltransferase
MSLSDAKPLDGHPLPVLEGAAPYSCAQLVSWSDRRYLLNPGHPELVSIHDGESPSEPQLENLTGARKWWFEHPGWMDFLQEGNTRHEDKLLERALYMDHWAEYIRPGCRVMDLGGGIGRFSQWCLNQGCEVELVDPDLRSLWAAVKHAGGCKGRFNVHWTTGDRLPDIAPVDVVIAAEVLCYVPDPHAVLSAVRSVLRPGGVLLSSVEARYGWAMGPDVAEGTLAALFGDGVVHVPGDRWTQTYTEHQFAALFEDFELSWVRPSHYVMSGPFEAAAGVVDVETIREIEKCLAADPITAPLNRAWMAAARVHG